MKTRTSQFKRTLQGIMAIGFASVLTGGAWAAAAKEPLKLIKSVPLPMLKDGDFDHFTADLASNRLFSAAEENSKLLVFDLKTGDLLKTLSDLKAPHSLVYRDDLKRLYVVDGGLGKIRMYDGATYKNVGDIDLREGADSMAYDPATKYMYVVNGGKDANMTNSYLTSVDTTTGKKLRDIELESNDVEAVVLDSSSPRVFVVIRGKDWIDVFNRETLAKLATWPLPKEVDKPTAMILDAKNHRLIIGTRAPGDLVLMDSNTGKVMSMETAAGMVDNLALNRENHQIYYAATEFLEVFQLQGPNNTGLLEKIPTRFRAKTGIFVPQLKRYYIGLPHHEGKIAELRIYEVS